MGEVSGSADQREDRFSEGQGRPSVSDPEWGLSRPVQAQLRRMRRYVNYLRMLCRGCVQWRLTPFPDCRWADGPAGAGLPHLSTPRKNFHERDATG
jgi:hypothetical protein